jgi:polo-like kinase 1
MAEVPEQLNKKFSLFHHFKEYLQNADKCTHSRLKQSHEQGEQLFVSRFKKTKFAIIFRLSNKFIQLRFKDSTELFIDTHKRTVIYVDKYGNVDTSTMSMALVDGNTDIQKRYKYA